jgi:Peptidase family M13
MDEVCNERRFGVERVAYQPANIPQHLPYKAGILRFMVYNNNKHATFLLQIHENRQTIRIATSFDSDNGLVQHSTILSCRVNGIMMNSEEFAKAFQCPTGTPMNPEVKCSMW